MGLDSTRLGSTRLGSETSQTLDRGLRLVRLLGEHGSRGLSVSELARELGVGRPVIYRMLATLDEHGWVRRLDDGRVRLGPAVLELAAAAEPVIRELATPLLRPLADDVGATAHLTVAEGEEGIAVAVVEPRWTTLHVAYRVGTRHPLATGAAGKAILAGRAGQRGPVATTGELERGASGLAVPLLGVPGLEASVGVVAVAALDEATVGPALQRTAIALADVLTRRWSG
jgi:DNA-binding IclR family transcriptional regulator